MYLVVTLAAVAGLLWAGVAALRGSLLAGCTVYLVLAAFGGQDFLEFSLAGIHISPDRVFLVGLLGAWLAQRWLGRTDSKPVGPGDVLLGAFFAVLLVGTFTSDWRTTSPYVSPVLPHLINGYLIPLVLFWIARQSAHDKASVGRVHVGLALFGVYLVGTALAEWLGLWGLVVPRYIADPELGVHFGRARGPMLQAATFGYYLVACLLATWIFLAWRAPWGRMGRLLAVGLLPLYGLAMFATSTRSVWVGGGLVVGLVVALTLQGAWRPVLLGGLVVGALGLVAVKGDGLVAFKRDGLSAEDTRESTWMRVKFAYVSWQMFQDRPLRGHGFGQFPDKSRYYLSDRESGLYLETIRGYINHNTILSLLVDVGLAGPLLFLALLAWWGRTAGRLWRATGAPAWVRGHALLTLGTLSAYGVQIMFRECTYTPLENGLLFLMAGTSVGLAARWLPQGSPEWSLPASESVARPPQAASYV